MARRASAVQVAANFRSRNQHVADARELSQHFSPNKSADCFFANPQLGCATFHVESLAFENCRRIHIFTFTRQQHLAYCDSLGVAATQPRPRESEAQLCKQFKRTRIDGGVIRERGSTEWSASSQFALEKDRARSRLVRTEVAGAAGGNVTHNQPSATAISI
jgi:hypothetical protein